MRLLTLRIEFENLPSGREPQAVSDYLGRQQKNYKISAIQPISVRRPHPEMWPSIRILSPNSNRLIAVSVDARYYPDQPSPHGNQTALEQAF